MQRHSLLGLLAVAIALITTACNSSCLEIYDTRCELLKEPLAIDNTQPHFSWKLKSARNGAAQMAYQILVASRPSRLEEGKADLWDSGRIESDNQFGIVYGGKQLPVGTPVYWKVRVWSGENDATPWSEPQRFGVGFTSNKDWIMSAKFIGAKQPKGDTRSAPLLRKKFQVTNTTKTTFLLHVNSLGFHEAYLNGHPLSSAPLAPAVSQFEKRSQIVTYDATRFIQKGENELVLWLGAGWYQPAIRGVVDGGPYVRAQLDAATAQGTKAIVATNDTWQVAESGRQTFGSWLPHQMGGEIVDERTAVHNITPKILDALQWQPAVVGDIPAHKATPQMCELNHTLRELHPIGARQSKDSCWIYDMGENFVGQTEIILPKMEMGKRIEFHYDDIHTGKNKFREGLYTDIYISDGEAEGVFNSKFNYKGYRYLKIKGITEQLLPQQITGIPITTNYSGRATFSCSDKDMNQIFHMVENTLEALTLGGYMVDCPQIERLGYGGDGNASTPTAQTFFNLAPLYLNWMQAWADCQLPNGDMPHTAPNPYSAGGGPFWCGFIITASWQTYVNYGDCRLLHRYFDAMERWIGFAESNFKDGLLAQWEFTERRNWYLGDWATPEGIDQTNPASVGVVTNCFMSDCYDKMSRISSTLGKDDKAAHYAARRDSLNATIHNAYYNAETGRYATATQIDMAYPLVVGATPNALRSQVREGIKAETATRFKGHLSTGLVGVPILTQWAIENGEAEFMYNMLKQRDYPGYLYMIDNDATLTWEHWNGERSHIHNCYNGIGRWFIQALAGIRPDEAQPGYRHFFIAPQMVNGITWAEAQKDSPFGPIHVRWERKDNTLNLEVEVPVGSTATVCLPAGATGIQTDANGQFTLRSGSYSMSCTLPKK